MKQIKRTLKPRFIVVFHQNCCGDDDGIILRDENDMSLSDSFSSITKAKKIMKRDIKEFMEIYPSAIIVTDLGGLRATAEMPFTNGNGKLDTFITEWRILEI